MVVEWLVLLALLCAVMVVTWLVQRRTGDAGIVDIVWTFALGFGALWFALLGSGALLPRVLMAACALAWSLRLGLYLVIRNRGKPEDGRYRAMREHWGDRTQPRLFVFFQAQALIAVLFALPYLAVAMNPTNNWNGWLALGLVMCAISILGEGIADRQLERFRRDPANRGRTCREGLWRYSRHPNYFFEWLHWFTYVLLAVGSPLWWLAWLGPVLMLAFVYRLTGIPWTEQQALKSRGEDYARYQRTTSPFIPWFPKGEES